MISYINFYNSVGSVIGVSALFLLLWNNFHIQKDFLLKMACIQSFYVIEIFNIFISASKAKIFPTVLQLSSRLFIIWTICYSHDILERMVYLMLFCWFTTDTVRYIFYLTRSGIFQFLRYNLFIFTYPVGTFCEIVLVSKTENISSGFFKYILRGIMLFYIPGFIFLFIHMLKRRSYAYKSSKNKKKQQ